MAMLDLSGQVGCSFTRVTETLTEVPFLEDFVYVEDQNVTEILSRTKIILTQLVSHQNKSIIR